MPTKGEGCGIHPFLLPKWEKFTKACIAHDAEFVIKEFGRQPKSRGQVDKEFLDRMKRLSSHGWDYVVAYLYYGIARTLGWIWW